MLSLFRVASCAFMVGITWASSTAYAAPLVYEPKKSVVEVPRDIQGVLDDPQASRSTPESLQYEVLGEFYSFSSPVPIETRDPQELAINNAWALVRRYLKVILSGRSQDLRALMSPEAWQTFSQVNAEAFKARSKSLKQRPRFKPLFAIDHKGAVLAHWLDDSGAIDLLPMRRKSDGTYEIHPFHAGEDPTLGNIFQYAYFRPVPPEPAQLNNPFKTWQANLQEVTLEARTQLSKGHILIFRESNETPGQPLKVLGIARDGAPKDQLLIFADQDPRPNQLRFKIKTSELRSKDQQPFEIYALELNYPPSGIPKGAQNLATRWKVSPP